MNIYRLERNGLGPFTQYIEDDIPFFKVTCEDVQYKKGDNKECFLYGVDDPDKLVEYFGTAYYDLLKVGFKVKAYNVPERRVRFSPNKKQVSFMEGDTELASVYTLRKVIYGNG